MRSPTKSAETKPAHISAIPTEVAEVKDLILYEPTSNQRKLKVKFWARFTASPLSSSESTPSLNTVISVTGSHLIRNWWKTPGFQEWFFNQDESREMVEHIFIDWLTRAQAKLESGEMADKDFIAVGKLICDLANRFSTKSIERLKGEDAAVMNDKSDDELVSLLEKKGIIVKREKFVEMTNKNDNLNASETFTISEPG